MIKNNAARLVIVISEAPCQGFDHAAPYTAVAAYNCGNHHRSNHIKAFDIAAVGKRRFAAMQICPLATGRYQNVA